MIYSNSNALCSYIILQILFMRSGNLRHALLTGSKLSSAYQELNIHLSNDVNIITARNFVIAHILVSEDFDPGSPADIDYLWNVWYSLQWTEDTRKRFLKDVQQLLSSDLTEVSRINIPDTEGIEIIKDMLGSWREMASATLIPETAKYILEERYTSF